MGNLNCCIPQQFKVWLLVTSNNQTIFHGMNTQVFLSAQLTISERTGDNVFPHQVENFLSDHFVCSATGSSSISTSECVSHITHIQPLSKKLSNTFECTCITSFASLHCPINNLMLVKQDKVLCAACPSNKQNWGQNGGQGSISSGTVWPCSLSGLSCRPKIFLFFELQCKVQPKATWPEIARKVQNQEIYIFPQL